MDGLREMVGRRVYVELNSNRKYTGTILDVDETLSLIKLKDKFDNIIWISFAELKLLQEESDV